jgi:hypothetical protein
MLTYAARMLTYAARMLTYAHIEDAYIAVEAGRGRICRLACFLFFICTIVAGLNNTFGRFVRTCNCGV